MATLSWTDYSGLTLSGYSGTVDWNSNPGYSDATTAIEWHIDISDSVLTITSADGATKYVNKDLKVINWLLIGWLIG